MSLQQQGHEQKPGPQRVAATPPRVALFLAGFCLVSSLLCLIPDKNGQTGWFMLLILLPGGTLALLYSLRTTTIADANGLRWRKTFSPWQDAIWDDVTDYFRVVDKTWGCNHIVFRDGRKLKIGSDWNDLKRLEAWVVEHAKNAKTSGWLIRGQEGTIQGSHTFTYSKKAIKTAKNLMVFLILTSLFMGIGLPLLAVWQSQKNKELLGVANITLLVFFTLFWGGMIARALWETRSCIKEQYERIAHGERFEADEQGLTFWRDGEPRHVAWSSLIVHKRHQTNTATNTYLYRLRTEEQEFSYTSTLSEWIKFQGMIALYAPQVVSAVPRTKPHDVLVSTEWDNGKRTFHYRTRGNRSGLGVLWSVPLFCAIGAGGIVAMWLRYGLDLHDLPWGELSVIVGFALLGVVVWLYLLWRYKTARLVLDRESLTGYGLWGKRRVFFENIATVGRDDLGFYIETNDGKRPLRWGANLASHTELLEELERRAGVSLP